MKKAGAVIGFLTGLIAIIYFGHDIYKGIAKAEDVKTITRSLSLMNERLQKNSLKDDIRYNEQRMLKMESDYGEQNARKKYEYKCLLNETNALKEELRKLK